MSCRGCASWDSDEAPDHGMDLLLPGALQNARCFPMVGGEFNANIGDLHPHQMLILLRPGLASEIARDGMQFTGLSEQACRIFTKCV